MLFTDLHEWEEFTYVYVDISVSVSQFDILGKYSYSTSYREFNEKIDSTLMSYSQLTARRQLGLAWHKDEKQGETAGLALFAGAKKIILPACGASQIHMLFLEPEIQMYNKQSWL